MYIMYLYNVYVELYIMFLYNVYVELYIMYLLCWALHFIECISHRCNSICRADVTPHVI